MLVLFSCRRRSDEVRDVLGEVAMVFCAVVVDRLLDVLPLLRCASSAICHQTSPGWGDHTVVKASQADFEAMERRQAVLRL